MRPWVAPTGVCTMVNHEALILVRQKRGGQPEEQQPHDRGQAQVDQRGSGRFAPRICADDALIAAIAAVEARLNQRKKPRLGR